MPFPFLLFKYNAETNTIRRPQVTVDMGKVTKENVTLLVNNIRATLNYQERSFLNPSSHTRAYREKAALRRTAQQDIDKILHILNSPDYPEAGKLNKCLNTVQRVLNTYIKALTDLSMRPESPIPFNGRSLAVLFGYGVGAMSNGFNVPGACDYWNSFISSVVLKPAAPAKPEPEPPGEGIALTPLGRAAAGAPS